MSPLENSICQPFPKFSMKVECLRFGYCSKSGKEIRLFLLSRLFSHFFLLSFSSTVPHCNQTVSSQICKRKLLKGSRTFIPSINQSEFQQNLSTALNTTVQRVGSPKCEETLKQLICSSYTPPCEGKTTMTLCLSKCDMLRDNCPKAFESFEVSSYCAEPADGNSDNGFCELKRWPSARHWDTGTF